jgi:hypothetical protein
MIPESANVPPVIASLGVAAAAGLPALEKLALDIPFVYLAAAQAALFAVNLFATSRPGRIDESEAEIEHKGKKTDTIFDVEKYLNSRLGRSMIAPAPWAFGIWGAIFLGELIACGYAFTLNPADPLIPVLRRTAGGFMAAQIFQTLWTASYRPKYNKGNLIYISAAMLSGVAAALNRSHETFAALSLPLNRYMFLFFPQALHFAWTSVAALVNINGNIAGPMSAEAKNVALAGHLSTIAATALGVGLTLTRRAPVVGGVFAWSLAAVSAALAQRAEKTKNVNPTRVGVFGLQTQRILSGFGTVACTAATVFTSLQRFGKIKTI